MWPKPKSLVHLIILNVFVQLLENKGENKVTDPFYHLLLFCMISGFFEKPKTGGIERHAPIASDQRQHLQKELLVIVAK